MGLFDFLSGKKEEPSVLGVDIGSSAIKIVQVKKKNGQAVLETYGELALGPYGGGIIGQAVQLAPDRIAQGLIDLMKEKEVNVTTKLAGISIPFASSLMAVMELPDVAPKELATMVPLEARRYIPVPINEVMLDWSVVPKIDEDVELPAPDAPAQVKKTEVLVVAIHNDTIARYQDIVQKAALDVSFFEIEIFSTMRSVVDAGLQPVMVMDMGAASTKLYIVERGVIKASHTINRGAQDITSAISQSLGLSIERAEVLKRDAGATGPDRTLTQVITLVLDSIFSEANRTLLGYEKKANKTVSKVILVGGGAALKGLADMAKTAFKTEAVVGNPFGKLSTPAFIEKVLSQTGPEFAVAIGLALRRLQDL